LALTFAKVFLRGFQSMVEPIKIGVIGDYDAESPTHQATDEALTHAANARSLSIQVTWLPTESLVGDGQKLLGEYDALWCAPGSPYRHLLGAIQGVQFAREQGVPFLGTCGGCQHAVIEYARNVLGFEDAAHAEYDPYASRLFITPLSCSLVGRAMSVNLDPSSRVAEIYRQTEVTEQYYCNFGLNPEYQDLLHDRGLRIVGRDALGEARVLELPKHPFFVATLFVPQVSSRRNRPHPLIAAYFQTAAKTAMLSGR
jgi:CTP synthase (UTP-ammonia lyase)